jgi:hypothetical protein
MSFGRLFFRVWVWGKKCRFFWGFGFFGFFGFLVFLVLKNQNDKIEENDREWVNEGNVLDGGGDNIVFVSIKSLLVIERSK